MLPHFVWNDFCDVMEEMTDFGYAMKAEWFAPHFEFRFPRLGDFAANNVDVELRLAVLNLFDQAYIGSITAGQDDARPGATTYLPGAPRTVTVSLAAGF